MKLRTLADKETLLEEIKTKRLKPMEEREIYGNTLEVKPTETVEFLTAFAKAQAQFKPAIKDAKNPHFNSKYADLNGVWEACKDALAANDLMVMQPTFLTPEGKLMLRTRVYHIKGGYTESIMPVLADNMQKAQSMGSGLTYTRRYSLAAVLGIVVDDDDAEGATSRKEEKVQPVASKQPAKAIDDPILLKALEVVANTGVVEALAQVWENHTSLQGNKQFKDAVTARKAELLKGKELANAS